MSLDTTVFDPKLNAFVLGEPVGAIQGDEAILAGRQEDREEMIRAQARFLLDGVWRPPIGVAKREGTKTPGPIMPEAEALAAQWRAEEDSKRTEAEKARKRGQAEVAKRRDARARDLEKDLRTRLDQAISEAAMELADAQLRLEYGLDSGTNPAPALQYGLIVQRVDHMRIRGGLA